MLKSVWEMNMVELKTYADEAGVERKGLRRAELKEALHVWQFHNAEAARALSGRLGFSR